MTPRQYGRLDWFTLGEFLFTGPKSGNNVDDYLKFSRTGLACVFGQFKSNGSPGLSLTHRRSINCTTIGSDIIDLNRDYVAVTVDGKTEHC